MKTSLTVSIVMVGVLAGVIADRLVIDTAVHAQEPPTLLNIGGESVFVGMPKDTALAKFAGKCEIGNLDGGRVLIGRSEKEPKIFRAVGVLAFQDGKLRSATRYWGDLWKGADGIEALWNALHGALAQQVGARRLTAELECSSHEQPGSQEDWISIHFPKRDIEIGKLHVDAKNGTNFYVRETVF